MKRKEIYWGILFIIGAILIIVNQLGYFSGVNFLGIAATVVLVGIMLDSLIHLNFGGVLFPAAFICMIFAKEWNITQLTPWPVLLTALLGTIGLSMIFKKHRMCNYTGWNHSYDGHKEHFDTIINEPDSNVVDCMVSFGSSMKYINTDHFERANINCSFGAMKVYFDNAIIENSSAVIQLDVSFAGVELYIPKNWKTVIQVNATLGGIDEKNRKEASDSPVVVIKGNIKFSGVEIIYV